MVDHIVWATMANSPLHNPHHLRNIILVILLIPICLIGALWFVAFAVSVFDRSDRISQGDYRLSPTAETANQAPLTSAYEGANKQLIEGTNNHAFGAANPKVTIVEFADFACPFCLASFPAMREVSLRHQDTVRVIFRDWPGHDYSISLALAAYCAGEQGKFWEMHDKLFQNQSDTFGSDKNQLAILAQQLGIYNQQFQTCFDNQKYLPQIRQNFLDSETLGVKGTPTWFINGRQVAGQLNTDQLEALVTEALKQ